MTQTKPFQIVTGASITPKQPFAYLYQHVRQKDPKLAETLDNLAQPASLSSNLSNPLQCLTAILTISGQSNWSNIVSNVPNDETNYFPVIAVANVDSSYGSDITIDIQVSHDGGNTFTTILNSLITIPSGQTGPIQVLTFAEGSYFKNLDLVVAINDTSDYSGGAITVNLLFQ